MKRSSVIKIANNKTVFDIIIGKIFILYIFEIVIINIIDRIRNIEKTMIVWLNKDLFESSTC